MTHAFGILIRSSGCIDRYARTQPHPHFPEHDLNAWPTTDPTLALRFETRDEAEAKACELAGRFGMNRHGKVVRRFDVIERRLVPRWFLVDPEDERERRPVGEVEQL